MPDWKKIAGEIAKSINNAALESQARRRAATSRGPSSNRAYPNKTCLFWDCNVQIRADHILCYDHYEDLQDGLINECPGCNKAKYNAYDLCLACYRNNKANQSRTTTANSQKRYRWYKPEYSQSWEKRDASAIEFFVYILKLGGGKFYAGQTRELRERLSEHRDGRVQSTAGGNPKLVWFATVPSREAATTMEVEMKKLVDSNPREIRRMIIKFRDLMRELDYS